MPKLTCMHVTITADNLLLFFNSSLLCVTVIEDEWRFFIRQDERLDLKQLAATNKSYAKLFPALRTMAIRVLLLPVSTAVVERSFSSIMTFDRTKLTNDHLDDTLFILIKGPEIPNPRTKKRPTVQQLRYFY